MSKRTDICSVPLNVSGERASNGMGEEPMAIQEQDIQTSKTTPTPPDKTENEVQSTVVVPGPYRMPSHPWWRGVASPLGILFLSIIVMVAILFFSIGSSMVGGNNSSSATTASTGSSSTPATSMGSSSTATT